MVYYVLLFVTVPVEQYPSMLFIPFHVLNKVLVDLYKDQQIFIFLFLGWGIPLTQ